MGNIALNGNVSASNTVAPFSASRAVDGTIEATHRWVGEVPCWLKLTCVGPKLVNRWVVSNMTKVTGVPAPGWPSPRYNMAEYSLQGSNDGINWATLDTVTGNQITTTDRTLVTPANYQFFRVAVTKGLNCNNKIASIMDFQLYEVPATSQYLSNLTISSGTLAPVFNKNTYSYTASVGCDVTNITITPTVEVPTAYGQNATIKVNGVTVASGAGTPVNLALGVNTIYIDVTSAVGNVTQRYTLTVTRVDTYLSNVKVMAGRATVNLNPAFSSDQPGYTGSCSKVTSLTVIPTADVPKDVLIYVNGTAVISGGSASVPVTAGTTNDFLIVVVYINNEAYTQTYNFAITVSN